MRALVLYLVWVMSSSTHTNDLLDPFKAAPAHATKPAPSPQHALVARAREALLHGDWAQALQVSQRAAHLGGGERTQAIVISIAALYRLGDCAHALALVHGLANQRLDPMDRRITRAITRSCALQSTRGSNDPADRSQGR